MTDSAQPHTNSPAESLLPQSPRAYLSAAAWMRYLIPAALGVIADLWLKSWAFPAGVPTSGLAEAGRHPAIADGLRQDPLPIIPHVLGFTTTVNQGAVFGLAQGHVPLFLAFSVLALGIIIWVFLTSRANQRIVHLALGLITAGAIGNVYDRAMFQGVRDMLKFYVDWYPYIFNIADALLCVGVPLLIIRWMFVKDPAEKSGPGFDISSK